MLRPRLGRWLLAAPIAVALSAAAACEPADTRDGDAPPAADTTTSRATSEATVASTTTVAAGIVGQRPFEFATRQETFVDTSRPTLSNGEQLAPDRTLVTHLYLPEGAGPYPVVVFSHGFQGHPRKFTQLLGSWASAGYVVAAPAFPLTNDTAAAPNAGDFVQQPADVSFVLTRVLETVPVADPERVGVAGLSVGGVTTYAVAFNSCCRDDRVDAAIAMAPNRFTFDGEYTFAGMPLMLMHGDADPALPYADTVEVYESAAPPKYFVTLERGAHAPPFEDTPDDHDEVVAAVTLAFWDATLLADPDAAARIRSEGTVAGLSRVDAVDDAP